MEAKCLNEDCEKDEWTLRKHPSQYARGGPACPECGTSRVEVSGADQQQAQQANPQQQAPQPAPANQQQDQGQQQGGLPAMQNADALQAGAQVGELALALGSDDPEKSAGAKAALFQGAGSALAHMGQKVAEQELQQAQRAKNASTDDISVSQDYPECPECGKQLRNIPEGEFQCPSCGVVLEYTG